MDWSSMTLEERERFILQHADRIAVRVNLDGRQWQSLFLTEVPQPFRQSEIERLALRVVEPVRLKKPPR
jgi:hypothetical protein